MENEEKGRDLKQRIEAAYKNSQVLEKKIKMDKVSGSPFQFGLELVAGLAVGGGVGFFIDKTLATMPLFFIFGLLLGFAGGFMNVIRNNQRDTEKSTKESHTNNSNGN